MTLLDIYDHHRRSLGAEIRARRNACGWSQRELAEHAGMCARHVGRIERAEVTASRRTVEAIELALRA